MSNTITHKQSAVAGKVPTVAQFAQGELAINTTDRKLYAHNGTTVFDLSSRWTDEAGGNISRDSDVKITGELLVDEGLGLGRIEINSVNKSVTVNDTGTGENIEMSPSSVVATDGTNTTILQAASVASPRIAAGFTGVPLAEVDVDGSAVQNVVALSSGVMDLGVGQVFTATSMAATTWSFANAPAGRGCTVVLHLTNGGAFAQTWPAAVKWPGGTAPTLTAAGVDVLIFTTHDGGPTATWRGNIFGRDVK